MIFIKNRIDRLAGQKKKLEAKKERISQRMNEKNASLTAEITKLMNETTNNEEKAKKKMHQIDLRIDRVMGDIANEKTYVNAVGQNEQDDYFKARKEGFDKTKNKRG